MPPAVSDRPHPARADLAVALLAVACAVVVAVAHVADDAPSDGPTWVGMVLAFTTVYAAAGAVLAWYGAAPVVRRVLLGIALTHGVAGVASAYASVAFDAAAPWPGGELALWLSSWLWSPAYIAVPVVLPLVLPDGRLVWRWTGWLAGAAVAATALSWALTPYELQDVPIEGHVNPVGVAAAAHPLAVGGVIALDLVAVAVALASLVVRHRRATGVARDQLRWLLLGVLGTVLVGGSAFVLPEALRELAPALAVVPFPAACVVALLRHRLWDIDVVLSRSLTYGLVSAAAVGAYVVAVALVGSVIGSRAQAPVLATAVVALLVLPLHARLQRLVNRLVHGDVDDPYTALARLGDRLEATADPVATADHVLPDLVVQVSRALRVPYVAVVLADGSRTSVGEPAGEVVTTPLVYAGAAVGSLRVTGPDLPRGERRLLEHLARQAGVAAHGVLVAREARRARAAAATAREEERRRLRRDLHDGMGPALAAVALQAETARDLVRTDPAAAEALLDRLVPRLNETVADIRTLVHDLRPPTLDELGLAGSVRELATRFVTPTRRIDVDAGELDVLPAAVDLAAYRIVAEALTNAAKHAGATSVRLVLQREAGRLEVRVCDDGVGVPAAVTPGVGLRSMRERAEELGGACEVRRGEDGRGTTLVATIPLQREA